ncbi:MAG: hypothetical protein UX23_C0006G0003 [Parcubacteria group bacterium GW2011_GWB1_45_9]|nr:MAG: hypothetical protein UX23_C0006G0003 [Parcubacteria group bacterium GW2011_GWB1_45_9]
MDKRFLILKRRHFFIIAAIAVAFLSFSLTAFAEDETIPDPAENIPNEVTPTPEPTPEPRKIFQMKLLQPQNQLQK